jgi:hypothetical protein
MDVTVWMSLITRDNERSCSTFIIPVSSFWLGEGFIRLGKHHDIIVFQELLHFLGFLESRSTDLLLHYFLARSNVVPHPIRTFPFDAMKIDDDESPDRLEGTMKSREGPLRILKVVICVANERNIDAVSREIDGVEVAENGRDVLQSSFATGFLNVFQELGGNSTA